MEEVNVKKKKRTVLTFKYAGNFSSEVNLVAKMLSQEGGDFKEYQCTEKEL